MIKYKKRITEERKKIHNNYITRINELIVGVIYYKKWEKNKSIYFNGFYFEIFFSLKAYQMLIQVFKLKITMEL